MLHFIRLRHLLRVGLCMLGCAAGLAQAADAVEELDLKAAYIFNFVQFIEWQESEAIDGEWPLCVSPFSPLKRPLTALEGKPARKGQTIRVRLLEPGMLRQCRVLILHSSDIEPVLRALRALPSAHGILTIADDIASSSPEIMITLSHQQNRIVFGINTDATARAGLSVSSRLLRLAKAAK
ncbi:MAG: YfiR family protein [Comamonadaceae bacterium]|nr:MAG: YfiR family protein [Comamonadaceae bacterium]